jgi:hypothetical protein
MAGARRDIGRGRGRRARAPRFYALVNVVGSILAGLGAAYCGLLLAQFFS